jgi:hypothetical protein
VNVETGNAIKHDIHRILHHNGVAGVGTSKKRTLGIKLRERCRPLAKMGVIEAPQVKLIHGFFNTIDEPTSLPTTPPSLANRKN